MSAREKLPSLAAYVLFTLTGVGQVLPGTLLPLLTSGWGGGDARSGLLFFLFFIGSSVGAIAARGRLGRMLALATVAMALPVALLDRAGGTFAPLAFLSDGFGLGLAMTSISLLQARRKSAARLAELTRMNLLWAAGACAGTYAMLRTASHLGLSFTLHAMAAALLITGGATALLAWGDATPPSGSWQAWRQVRQTPLFFALTLPLVTGVEAAAGGWLTTYATREFRISGVVITTATAMWAGLLLSRAIFSGRHAEGSNRREVLSAFAVLPIVGLALLVGMDAAPAAVAGAFLVGFGIGPLYPWLLTRLLNRTEAGNGGFLAAGFGAAVLPLLTGQLSQLAHSLRVGLLLPATAACVLACALLVQSFTREKA